MIIIIASTYRVGEMYRREHFGALQPRKDVLVITEANQLRGRHNFEYVLVTDDMPLKTDVLATLDYLKRVGSAVQYDG